MVIDFKECPCSFENQESNATYGGARGIMTPPPIYLFLGGCPQTPFVRKLSNLPYPPRLSGLPDYLSGRLTRTTLRRIPGLRSRWAGGGAKYRASLSPEAFPARSPNRGVMTFFVRELE